MYIDVNIREYVLIHNSKCIHFRNTLHAVSHPVSLCMKLKPDNAHKYIYVTREINYIA